MREGSELSGRRNLGEYPCWKELERDVWRSISCVTMGRGQAGRFDSLLVSNRRICMGFPTANTI